MHVCTRGYSAPVALYLRLSIPDRLNEHITLCVGTSIFSIGRDNGAASSSTARAHSEACRQERQSYSDGHNKHVQPSSRLRYICMLCLAAASTGILFRLVCARTQYRGVKSHCVKHMPNDVVKADVKCGCYTQV
jgi:hypothetical protein